jgi:hypothetical protein
MKITTQDNFLSPNPIEYLQGKSSREKQKQKRNESRKNLKICEKLYNVSICDVIYTYKGIERGGY